MAEEKPELAAFMAEISKLGPNEITWMFSILQERAMERLVEIEQNIMRHERFNRLAEAEKAKRMESIYQKLILLRKLWQNAELEYSAPLIVEAVTGRKPKPPSKKV